MLLKCEWMQVPYLYENRWKYIQCIYGIWKVVFNVNWSWPLDWNLHLIFDASENILLPALIPFLNCEDCRLCCNIDYFTLLLVTSQSFVELTIVLKSNYEFWIQWDYIGYRLVQNEHIPCALNSLWDCDCSLRRFISMSWLSLGSHQDIA